MTKPSPGPWEPNTDGTVTRKRHNTDRQEICRVYNAGAEYGETEFNANARLIAAAPDLLDALLEAEAALSAIEQWCGYGVLTGQRAKVWNCVGDRLERIQSAIAKARGGND